MSDSSTSSDSQSHPPHRSGRSGAAHSSSLHVSAIAPAAVPHRSEQTAANENAMVQQLRLGDTRSIVLALQSLQEKIRRLESDRNFHQEECDRARHAHELYKREVERQLDNERSEFRRREAELQELISRAQHERSKLQSSLDDSRSDIGTFRQELQTLLDRERRDARERETRLVEELTQIRSDLSQEKHRLAIVQQEMAQAKAEKDVLDANTKRLEGTVKDLLAMNTALVERARGMAAAGATQHAAPITVQAVAAAAAPPPTSKGRRMSPPRQQPPMRFASPTLTSARRSASVPKGPTPSTPRRQTDASSSSSAGLAQVYQQLENELTDLKKQYQVEVRKAGDSGLAMSPEVLTATLNALMAQIDRKTEQLRLLRMTQSSVDQDVTLKSSPPMARGVQKATEKAALCNALKGY
jgi:hypothetical protein